MTRMSCERCQTLLDTRLDGDALMAVDNDAVEIHLAECRTCRDYARDMAALVGVAATLQDTLYERPVEIAPLVLRPRTAPLFLAGALSTAGVAAVFAIGIYAGGLRATRESSSPLTQVVRLVVPVPQAKRVEVVGDFTGWKERVALTPTADGFWVGEVKVTPGRYKYMIVVDDAALQPDPAAREEVDDGFGGKNSVLEVGSI